MMVKVIVCITTYNLEKYISKAIDSVLCQVTNFDFKIIVADDCSTDGTLKILLDYKKTFPEKIEILTADNNQGSLANSNRLFDGIKCEYLSFLDGDDYWTKETRLQEQVDFLDKHPNYSMCAGNTQYLIEEVLGDLVVPKKKLNKTFYFRDYLEGSMPFLHTSSILLRNNIFVNGIPRCYKDAVGTVEECALRGEDFRRILHLEKGPAFVMGDVVSVYRIHEKGIWQGSSIIKRTIETTISAYFYNKYFGKRYGKVFENRFQRAYAVLLQAMLINQSFASGYFLSNKESILFTGFLNDISIQNPIYNKSASKAKMFFVSFLLKIIRRIC